MSESGRELGQRLGATLEPGGVRFAVQSGTADRVWVSMFDPRSESETGRVELTRTGHDVFSGFVPGLKAGAHYGLRADGRYNPPAGYWFDPAKLLVDPYATAIDRHFRYDPSLAAPRPNAVDTAAVVPKSVVTKSADFAKRKSSLFRPGGLIYELSVRGFTMRHPGVRSEKRGTIAALGEPVVIEHLLKIGVDAVELMPVVAWIDERHLPPLGLSNAWGYNPVAFMPLDPRLAPGGIAELRDATAALHEAGIAVILDLVFNHTGESDEFGPTLSLRGLDNLASYRHLPGETRRLANDTGCGNTVACDHPAIQELILSSLRHFVLQAGVDGFRFDLAPVLGRVDGRFAVEAPLFSALREDPVLSDRTLIAEPWDIGPDGYRLGGFPSPFLEWNDRFRDDVRRFWRGDAGTIGPLATRLAGSSDVFGGDGATVTRTVNFIAAHDGMTLADLAAYEHKHNEANGEDNRDGHDENLSWNNGIEGETRDPAIVEARRRDAVTLLATLFASRGTLMLSAGDEFGRSQGGNNNAYAQDNETTWLDWIGRDRGVEDWVAALAMLRRSRSALFGTGFFLGNTASLNGVSDVEWLTESGQPVTVAEWEDTQRRRLAIVIADPSSACSRLAVLINGDCRATVFSLPGSGNHGWTELLSFEGGVTRLTEGGFLLQGRSVAFAAEVDG
ncbi:MAG: glycogen debranching protein GlgX [Rhizobiaceae bacterium]